MDDVFNKEENQKNIYVIKHKLSELKKAPNGYDWVFSVGDFRVVIKVAGDDYWAAKANKEDTIVRHEKLDVVVYEHSRVSGNDVYVDLLQDSRFKNYKPIEYNYIDTPTGGHINLSNGTEMPLIKVCELIRYLYRLSNLTAFL